MECSCSTTRAYAYERRVVSEHAIPPVYGNGEQNQKGAADLHSLLCMGEPASDLDAGLDAARSGLDAECVAPRIIDHFRRALLSEEQIFCDGKLLSWSARRSQSAISTVRLFPLPFKAIGKDIPLSNQQFSTLQSAFLFSYAFMYAGGGKLADALGTRTRLHGDYDFLVVGLCEPCAGRDFAMLAVSRFLLGMGEGGGFPAATRAVAEWFPTAMSARVRWASSMREHLSAQSSLRR